MAYFNVGKVEFEGSKSTNPYAFKFYNPTEVVAGKTMEEHLRFAMAYWHTLTAGGSDPFGADTAVRPWDSYSGMDLAKARVEAGFEFMEKLNLPYFCFHDVDIAPEGNSLREFYQNIDTIVDQIEQNMKSTGKNCCGTQPTCSRTHATCMVQAPPAMQTSTRMLLRRSRRALKSANASAQRTTCSGRP